MRVTEVLLQIGVFIGLPGVLAVLAWVFKNSLSRIEYIERKLEKTMSEADVRQIIADKLDPIREDVQEIRKKIDKLFDLYVNNK